MSDSESGGDPDDDAADGDGDAGVSDAEDDLLDSPEVDRRRTRGRKRKVISVSDSDTASEKEDSSSDGRPTKARKRTRSMARKGTRRARDEEDEEEFNALVAGQDAISSESEESSDDDDDDDSGVRVSASGRPSRRAGKSKSLNENALYKHSLHETAPAPRNVNPNRKWGKARGRPPKTQIEEVEEDESSDEEPLNEEQQLMWDTYHDRQPQLILAMRENPDQAKRLAAAKEKKQSESSPKPDAAVAPPAAATPATSTTTAPTIIELSDSDDEKPAKPVKTDKDSDSEEEEIIYQFFVKFKGMGYLHCLWLDEAVVEKFERGYDMIGRFLRYKDRGDFDEEEWADGVYFNQNYLEVERIVARRGPSITKRQALASIAKRRRLTTAQEAAAAAAAAAVSPADGAADAAPAPDGVESAASAATASRDTSEYLVKWRDLPYTEATWESRGDINDDDKIEHYWKMTSLAPRLLTPKPRPVPPPPDLLETIAPAVRDMTFKNPDIKLRPYQVEGVTWMAFNWMHKRTGQILADEMGLGKVQNKTHSMQR